MSAACKACQQLSKNNGVEVTQSKAWQQLVKHRFQLPEYDARGRPVKGVKNRVEALQVKLVSS
jgi:hypothetical protein